MLCILTEASLSIYAAPSPISCCCRASPGSQLIPALSVKTCLPEASLVAQWLRICLPMQGTRVRALVWEDPTCRGATRPVSHNY